eukprot:scpid58711/ scgid8387/ 
MLSFRSAGRRWQSVGLLLVFGIALLLLAPSTQRQWSALSRNYFAGNASNTHQRRGKTSPQILGPCVYDPESGAIMWQTFPQCSVAQRGQSKWAELPSIVDVFATGTPCARDSQLKTESEKVRMEPTVHFVLDLEPSDEGRGVSNLYKRWFPEANGFSSSEYECKFSLNGETSSVERSSNHDNTLWPEEGDCSKAHRYRCAILTCAIPNSVARESLAALQKYRSSASKSAEAEQDLTKAFQVQLRRRSSSGSQTAHYPVSFACPLHKPDKNTAGVVKPPTYIPMRSSSSNGEAKDKAVATTQDLSVGICTMVSKACGLEEWLQYYLFIGVRNAYILDNSQVQDGKISSLVQAWNKRQGVARFARVLRWEWAQKQQWWITQSNAMNACVRRHSSLHQWIITSDVDERMVPIDVPAEPNKFESLIGRFIRQLDKQNDLEFKSSLLVSNWDMINSVQLSSKASDRESGKCYADSSDGLLIELGDQQCKDGPSSNRPKSVMNTNWRVNQIIDQGHCTAIGKGPLSINPRTELRMNHYFSHTQTGCSNWEDADEHLLTSKKEVHAYLRKKLALRTATAENEKH